MQEKTSSKTQTFGSIGLDITIYSPNFIQVGIGRDKKWFFQDERYNNCRAKGDNFVYVKPCKTVF